MEKTKLGFVLPMEVGWSDVGVGIRYGRSPSKDENGNSIYGNVITEKSENCFLMSNNRLVVALGINDLIVVETNDALLVLNKEKDQDVKKNCSYFKATKISRG